MQLLSGSFVAALLSSLVPGSHTLKAMSHLVVHLQGGGKKRGINRAKLPRRMSGVGQLEFEMSSLKCTDPQRSTLPSSLPSNSHVVALVLDVPHSVCPFNQNHYRGIPSPSSQGIHNWVLAHNLLRCT